MTRRRLFLLVLCLVLAATTSSQGQVIYGQPASGNPQFVYSHWKLQDPAGDEITVSQSYLPLVGYVPLKDNLELQFHIANSSNALKFEGYDKSLSGLSDLRLQVTQSLSDDRFVLSGSVNLPVGKKKLRLSDEWIIVEALSQDFLSLPTRRLGEGFGFSMLAGGATMLGETRVGGGLVYQFNGEYQPYEESGDYDPGDIISANAGGDLQKGGMRWSANAIFTAYTADKQKGIKTFRQSPQFLMSVAGTYETEAMTAGGGVSFLVRGRNVVYDSTETILSKLKLFGNEFAINGAASWKLAPGWFAGPSALFRHIAANEGLLEAELGSASVFGAGVNGGKTLGEHFTVDVGFMYFTGSADAGDIDLTGYQLTASLLATL
ncbi:MAG: hypothetical protein OEW00_04855 [candidate division Zixibacteria bacterium]|nr:hypothetical protein [candidate division Zixibacteria bacterium]